MTDLHHGLSEKKWFEKELVEQMSNIGAEVGRAILWGKKDSKQAKAAFDRAIELLDLTIEDKKNQKGSLKELCRLKSALVDYFDGENAYNSNDKIWNNYFYFFNVASSIKYF